MANKSNKSKPTHLYASISIAIVLFLLGLFFVIFIHTQDISNILKEKVNVVVELNEHQSAKPLLKFLEKEPMVLSSSIMHYSNEQGLDFMIGGSSVDFDGENPLHDLIVFNVNSEAYSEENLEKIKLKLLNTDKVSGVYYENMILENIKDNLRLVALVIFVIGGIFVLLATVIIRNTINLSMYADKDEILTLQRIGAKWNFIKMPYIKSSVLIGVKGLVIASVLLVLIFVLIFAKFPTVWMTLNVFYILLSFILLLLIAIAVPALVSNATANKYLSRK